MRGVWKAASGLSGIHYFYPSGVRGEITMAINCNDRTIVYWGAGGSVVWPWPATPRSRRLARVKQYALLQYMLEK